MSEPGTGTGSVQEGASTPSARVAPAQRLAARRDEFEALLESVAHDLRSPLLTMALSADLLQDAGAAAREQVAYAALREGIRDLERMLDAVTTLSRAARRTLTPRSALAGVVPRSLLPQDVGIDADAPLLQAARLLPAGDQGHRGGSRPRDLVRGRPARPRVLLDRQVGEPVAGRGAHGGPPAPLRRVPAERLLATASSRRRAVASGPELRLLRGHNEEVTAGPTDEWLLFPR